MAKMSKYLSAFLKAETLKATGPQTFTITGTTEVVFEARDGRPAEKKPALVTRNEDSDEVKVILNKENLRTLIDAFGEDSDDWRTKTVEAFFDKNVSFGGKRVGGLRLRVPEPDEILFDQAGA